MFDKNFYQQVFDVTVDKKVLSQFCHEMHTKREFDADNAFEKYYDVQIIEKAIEKYQSGEVNADYLATWANVYNWILCGGFLKDDGFDKEIYFVQNQISECLDSLSFFEDDEEYDFYNLDVYRQEFLFWDRVYKNFDGYRICMTHGEGSICDVDEIFLLFINDMDKSFVQYDTGCGCDEVDFDQSQYIGQDTFECAMQQLLNDGYKQIKTPFQIEFENMCEDE